MNPEERALIDAAWKQDPVRYAEMDGAVFNATVPFGSSVRWEDLRARSKTKSAKNKETRTSRARKANAG